MTAEIYVHEAAPQGTALGTVLCVHGFPESGYMWRDLLPELAGAGWRAIAPDLPGSGDSPSRGDGSWTAQVAALDEVYERHAGGEPVVLVMHDWGGLIGLRWALGRPAAVRALVVSDTGYFPEGEWHDFAKVMRTPGEGEAFIEQWTEAMLGQILSSVSAGITPEAVAEYSKALATPEGRRGALELYRSGNFDEIEPGCLARLEMPALVLWGESDPFAPVAGAHRFLKELGGDSELVVVDGAGHFVYEDDPQACAGAILPFLRRV